MAKERSKTKRGGGHGARGGGARARGGGSGGGAGGSRGGVARSQEDLAAVHGVSRQAVAKWVRDPRWRERGFRTVGPWNAAEIARQKEWRREVLRERTDAGAAGAAGGTGGAGGTEAAAGAGGDLGRAGKIAQIRLLVAKEEALKLEMAIKQGHYIKRAESEEKQAEAFRAVRGALMQLPKALRQLLADTTDPLQIETFLEEALRRICVEGFGKE